MEPDDIQVIQSSIQSWTLAGCPVPLNWWDSEQELRYKDRTGPYELDSLIEFGGSMAGLMLLDNFGGDEGRDLANKLAVRIAELNRKTAESISKG